MASYLDKQGLQTFLDCLREEELSPIQNDVSNLQQTKADKSEFDMLSEKIDRLDEVLTDFEEQKQIINGIKASVDAIKGEVNNAVEFLNEIV